jgi:DNA modification methylase
MSASPSEIIGNATLYLGDCKDIMPELGLVDAVVTDPPYGINVVRNMSKVGGNFCGHGNRRVKKKEYKFKKWDEKIQQNIIDTLLDFSKYQIIFGGNHYELPPTTCWFIWDKLNGKNYFADFEMAWTNLKSANRKIDWLWNGMARAELEKRYDHPTQKPLGVMEWCINQLPKSENILDPFMGSGTTGVACINLGKEFIGIEKDPEYFDIACKRISDAEKQGNLFVQQKQKPEQVELPLAV